jgi:sensor histidine kinase YesM
LYFTAIKVQQPLILKFGSNFEIIPILTGMSLRGLHKIFKANKIYLYIVYWIVYLAFFSVQRFFANRFILSATGLVDASSIATFKLSFLTNLAYLPEVIISTHFVVDFLLPRFYFRNRFYIFSFLLALTILINPAFSYLVRTYIVGVYIDPNPAPYSFYNFFATVLIFMFGLAPLAWFKIAAHLREELLLHQKLDNDRLKALLKLKETELKLLKAQLHPHFLFNTLNNLYSLALEKSDKTPDLIIRLGDMLSYIIYDCNSDKVPLTKEVDFIKSFIELQKVRFESCDIVFNIEGDITNQSIAPMLLHTFIDNSFKHGAAKTPGKSWIKLNIELYNGTLEFLVVNSKMPKRDSPDKISGIGIENTLKRLDHIYKERHELKIDDSENEYSVYLKLRL